MRSSDPFSHPRDQSLGQGNAAYLVSPNWQPRSMSRTASIRAAVEKRTNEFAAGLRWRGIVGSAIIGAIVGATIMTTGAIIEAMLDVVLELDAIWHVVLPLLGLAAATWILRRPPAQSPATADAYIASFHDNGQRLGGWAMIRRIWASVVSLGSGVPLGFEGPSIYIGATIGALIRRRMPRLLQGTDARAFLVAGAAAGVSAVFRAPATGAIFALEVPYQSDVAPRVELHAMTAAATSYLVVALSTNTDRLFALVGDPPLVAADMFGAIAVGLIAGLVARFFALGVKASKTVRFATKPYWFALVCLPAGTVAAGALGHAPLGLTGGANVVEWIQDESVAVWVVFALLFIRAVVTISSLSLGAIGGVFIPLVSMGALCGKLVGQAMGSSDTITFVLVGAAAFLAAGYRTPLAALMFVAETTGRPGFVVPGLIGVVAAQFVVGDASVSSAQRKNRATRLERRSAMPVARAMSKNLKAIPPSTPLDTFVQELIPDFRERVLPVVDGEVFLGVAVLDDALTQNRDTWPEHSVSAIARKNVPIATPDWTVRQALSQMEVCGLDQLPVVADDRLVGMIRRRDVQRWDELLERTERIDG